MFSPETQYLQCSGFAWGALCVVSQAPGVCALDCVNYVNLESFSLRKMNAAVKEQGL